MNVPTKIRTRIPHRRRTRRTIESIYLEVGPQVFKRMYRMTYHTFLDLVELLEPFMKESKKRKRGADPNGPIPNALRVALALRYFCGGCPHDIPIARGVSKIEVYISVWRVVDAVNKCPQLQFEYPTSHEEQANIALGFQEKSTINLDNCAGAIDCILIWINQPTRPDIMHNIKFGGAKFFCGRKKKLVRNTGSKNWFINILQ